MFLNTTRSILTFLFFLWTFQLFSNDIILTDDTKDIEIGKDFIKVFEDTSAQLIITDIIADSSGSLFNEFNKIKFPHNKITASAYWIKFTIKNSTNQSKNWLIEVLDPHIDNLSFYSPDKFGVYDSQWAGYDKPFDKRNYQHKNFLFDISLAPKEVKTFYLRIQSTRKVGFFFKIRTNKYFTYYSLNEYYLLGIYYGILAIMAIYNLLIFFSIRERVYIYYVLYVLSCALVSFLEDGTGFQYLWSNSPKTSILLESSARLLLVTFFYLYSHTFLNLNRFLPKFNNIIFGSVIVFIAFYITERFHQLHQVSDYLFIIPFILIYISSFVVLKKGYRPSRYFVFGYSIVFISIIVILLRQNGIIQNNLQNAFIDKIIVYALNIGIIIEIVILSRALGERIKFMKLDRERAQKRIIEQLTVNDRLKDKVNRELEEKVSERTQELNQKNQAIIDSINYAKRIQETVLPTPHDLEKTLGEHFIYYLPKDIVSGDFYWAEQKGDLAIFAAVDCTGHGVPGALMSILAYNVLHYAVSELHLTQPSEILTAANRRLKQRIKEKNNDPTDSYGMDIALCTLNRKDNILSYAGAFNPLIIVRQNEILEVKADRASLGHTFGEREITTLQNHEIKVHKGDMIYIFSDGYSDQFGGKGKRPKKLMFENFKKHLVAISTLELENQKESLHQNLTDWKGDFEQIDDILIIGVRI